MKWPHKCSSSDFDMACAEYDRSDLESMNMTSLNEEFDRIYVSKLSRSLNTAKSLFPDKEYFKLPEIGEVPLKSFVDTKKRLPLWLWNVLGRVQWFIGSTRQLETRKNTILRANKVIDLCESGNEDCVLTTHGFFMKTLIKVLKKRGYLLLGDKRFKFDNLQVLRAEKLWA